jgi:dolichyl-phosphate-mannose-protein mannosyltransferase
MVGSVTVRTPVGLYVLAFAVRAVLFAVFPDPAYPDSSYYVEVARSIAAGHGLNVDFIWIFAEVGNRIPNPAVLPVPSNAHWLPLASFLQAPFISILGPTALASALPGMLIGAFAAPLTWFIARDAGARPLVAGAAAALVAVPGTATAFMAQPETFGLSMVLVPFTLWCCARGLRGDGRAFVFAGLGAGLMALARNDGVLLAGTVGLIWVGDRLRAWRARHGRHSWSHVDDRAGIPVLAAVLALGLFLLVVAPWWLRQLAVFGSISPTSSSGAALWIRNIDEWNSITAQPSLDTFLAQGPAAILASRLAGLASALEIFATLVCGVVLVPFLLIGALARRHVAAFHPWFAYALVVFAGATLLYPVHVPGGTFIHTAIGLLPGAAILSVDGLLVVVSWLAGRRRHWDEGAAARVLAWGVVGIVIATGVAFAGSAVTHWEARRDQRLEVAAALDQLNAPRTDRILSIDAGGMRYWTGHPGVVTTNDPLDTIASIAQAYDIRWLILERDDLATAMAPVLAGQRPAWIGPPRFTMPSADGGLARLELYPVCVSPADARCSGG